MINSWDIGSVRGIKLRIHWTFLLLPLGIFASAISSGTGLASALTSVLLVIAIFGCVLLHELGHAFAAQQFGIGTRDITLLPIGGVAALERIPRIPLQELWITSAGPLVNVVIALIFFAIQIIGGSGSSAVDQFFYQLMLANVILVLFNLIPAFPMDGGRILRSLLAFKLPYEPATAIAARTGQLCAVGLGLFGLFSGQLMMLLVALFVYFAARSENRMVQQQPSSVPPSSAEPAQPNSHRFNWLRENRFRNDGGVPSCLSIQSVAAWLTNQRLDHCQIIESGRVIGEVTRPQLTAAIYRGLGGVPVSRLVTA
ncbi:site-2 protease family protein [Mariniblastus sp.]|nr:site-2 protease family protein [Mariniblastus sp.]